MRARATAVFPTSAAIISGVYPPPSVALTFAPLAIRSFTRFALPTALSVGGFIQRGGRFGASEAGGILAAKVRFRAVLQQQPHNVRVARIGSGEAGIDKRSVAPGT